MNGKLKLTAVAALMFAVMPAMAKHNPKPQPVAPQPVVDPLKDCRGPLFTYLLDNTHTDHTVACEAQKKVTNNELDAMTVIHYISFTNNKIAAKYSLDSSLKIVQAIKDGTMDAATFDQFLSGDLSVDEEIKAAQDVKAKVIDFAFYRKIKAIICSNKLGYDAAYAILLDREKQTLFERVLADDMHSGDPCNYSYSDRVEEYNEAMQQVREAK